MRYNEPSRLMTDQTKQVLKTLMQDHVGESNAVTQAQLAENTGLNTSTLRSELRRLREERQIPIANLRDGYFIIADREELSDFVGHINSEIESKRNTIEHTLKAFEEFDGDVTVEIDDSDDDPEIQEQTYRCSVDDCDREIPRSNTYWPKSGEYEDQTVCTRCYGSLVIDGQA